MYQARERREREEEKRKEGIANSAMDSVYYDFLGTRRYNPSTVKILQDAGVSWRDAHAMDTAMKTASERVLGSGSGVANAAKKEGAAAERVRFRLLRPTAFRRDDNRFKMVPGGQ